MKDKVQEWLDAGIIKRTAVAYRGTSVELFHSYLMQDGVTSVMPDNYNTVPVLLNLKKFVTAGLEVRDVRGELLYDRLLRNKLKTRKKLIEYALHQADKHALAAHIESHGLSRKVINEYFGREEDSSCYPIDHKTSGRWLNWAKNIIKPPDEERNYSTKWAQKILDAYPQNEGIVISFNTRILEERVEKCRRSKFCIPECKEISLEPGQMLSLSYIEGLYIPKEEEKQQLLKLLEAA